MKMTKAGFGKARARVVLIALCTTVLSAVPLMAQGSSAPPPPPEQGDSRPMGRPGPAQMQERQLEMMTKDLNLTPNQVTQIKATHADMNRQMLALRDDTSTAQEDKREKMMAVRKASNEKVRGQLTADQATKFDAMQARMRERREEHRGGTGEAPRQ